MAAGSTIEVNIDLSGDNVDVDNPMFGKDESTL
jgi:hypothetical protein